MSWLDKILQSKGTKVEQQKEEASAAVRNKLKAIVYDDSIVEELTPVFMKLQGAEGFDKVLELLETKERQIEAMSGGDWFKQETDPENKQSTEDSVETENYVDAILKQRYGE